MTAKVLLISQKNRPISDRIPQKIENMMMRTYTGRYNLPAIKEYPFHTKCFINVPYPLYFITTPSPSHSSQGIAINLRARIVVDHFLVRRTSAAKMSPG